jgi:hypothetical protein
MLCIDPGNCSGLALFHGGRLVWCGDYAADPSGPPFAHLPIGASHVLIERPTIYPLDKMRGDPNDLIKVALTAGRWAEAAARIGCVVEYVEPRTWKGQTPKEIHNRRVTAQLDAREQTVIPQLPATRLHNVIDAIGLGLWKLRRIR